MSWLYTIKTGSSTTQEKYVQIFQLHALIYKWYLGLFVLARLFRYHYIMMSHKAELRVRQRQADHLTRLYFPES